MVNGTKLTIKQSLYWLFLLLSVWVTALLLLAAVPLYLPIWWLDNLLNLQPQWSLLACLLLIINVIYIHKLTSVMAIVYGTLITYNMLPLYLPPPSEVGTTHQFTIAQANLNYDNPNLTELLPILADKKFAMLVLQEASDLEFDKIQQLSKYYPYTLGLAPSESTPSGMALFSRYPISEQHIYTLGGKSGHLLEVIVQLPGMLEPIQVYAIHPTSPRNANLWRLRNRILNEVTEKVIASPFAHQIIIGDFNSSPWSGGFRQLQTRGQLRNSAQGFGYIASWSYSNIPLLRLFASAYIDHCLISKGFSVKGKQKRHIIGSDHQMMLTQLAI